MSVCVAMPVNMPLAEIVLFSMSVSMSVTVFTTLTVAVYVSVTEFMTVTVPITVAVPMLVSVAVTVIVAASVTVHVSIAVSMTLSVTLSVNHYIYMVENPGSPLYMIAVLGPSVVHPESLPLAVWMFDFRELSYEGDRPPHCRRSPLPNPDGSSTTATSCVRSKFQSKVLIAVAYIYFY